LPTTGFADEVGLPGLLGLAALLIIVIVITRRLRFSTTR
jgi:LPXTG-motif cell wall-anchored protein